MAGMMWLIIATAVTIQGGIACADNERKACPKDSGCEPVMVEPMPDIPSIDLMNVSQENGQPDRMPPCPDDGEEAPLRMPYVTWNAFASTELVEQACTPVSHEAHSFGEALLDDLLHAADEAHRHLDVDTMECRPSDAGTDGFSSPFLYQPF